MSYLNITALLDAEVDYVNDRERNTPADQRESYRVLEDIHVMAGPRKRDPAHRLRRILVHSTGNARGQQAAARGAVVPQGRPAVDALAGAASD
ncbi:hypothetical protein RCO28_26275 [Streptomyces sp. LHD-70]|uniref:hypothetical protein n=1 Tax=Streptomyces sp. LHD-70 TaxID=3072140 RepID=UPI00280E2000|nr:hypothetical protein [Streptomyces sp. LHD-70]MDQ8705964.1 hypothetical protein [Streptomyces sp. LHD-70]